MENIQPDPVEEMAETTPAVADEPVAEPRPEETIAAETVTEAAPAETGGEKENPDIAALVAEAEQRGYLRGLNECAAGMMERPALLENMRRRTPEPERSESFASQFLQSVPRNVWD